MSVLRIMSRRVGCLFFFLFRVFHVSLFARAYTCSQLSVPEIAAAATQMHGGVRAWSKTRFRSRNSHYLPTDNSINIIRRRLKSPCTLQFIIICVMNARAISPHEASSRELQHGSSGNLFISLLCTTQRRRLPCDDAAPRSYDDAIPQRSRWTE